jgi:hypothetical protein
MVTIERSFKKRSAVALRDSTDDEPSEHATSFA